MLDRFHISPVPRFRVVVVYLHHKQLILIFFRPLVICEIHNAYFQTKVSVEAFKENIPLIQTICNPGLRDRHWAQLSEIVGFPIKPDEVRFYLNQLKHNCIAF